MTRARLGQAIAGSQELHLGLPHGSLLHCLPGLAGSWAGSGVQLGSVCHARCPSTSLNPVAWKFRQGSAIPLACSFRWERSPSRCFSARPWPHLTPLPSSTPRGPGLPKSQGEPEVRDACASGPPPQHPAPSSSGDRGQPWACSWACPGWWGSWGGRGRPAGSVPQLPRPPKQLRGLGGLASGTQPHTSARECSDPGRCTGTLLLRDAGRSAKPTVLGSFKNIASGQQPLPGCTAVWVITGNYH